MKFSILAVGTELTTGQILNRNAQWLSRELDLMGFAVAAQLVVPDDRELILQSLEYLAGVSDCIIVTGGLGPTGDDFTREVVASWAQAPLIFDEPSWQKISEQLTQRQVPVRDSHRQECLFPSGAKILQNTVGTANGFSLNIGAKKLFVLPGPPNEIESLWRADIAPEIAKQIKPEDQFLTLSWDTMGLAESEVADLLQSKLGNQEEQLAYRVHRPYVEVKLRYQSKDQKQSAILGQQIDQLLRPYTISRHGEDLAQKFFKQLEKHQGSLVFVSPTHLTDLMQRLQQLASSRPGLTFTSVAPNGLARDSREKDLRFTINGDFVEAIVGSKNESTTLVCPRPQPTAKWHRAWQLESALIYWLKYV